MTASATPPVPDFLRDGGEVGALMRAFDWAATSLGPIASWPGSLRTTVGILLRSPVPMVLLWGEDGVMIYNDAYSAFAGGRHPRLLGSKVREGWPEVAAFNDHVMRTGLAGRTLSFRDQELTLHRRGVPEQVWMNLDYSPVLDESGRPAGVLAVVVETTEAVVSRCRLEASEGRLSFLDRLAEATQPLTDATDVMRVTARMLGEHLRADVCAYADMEPDADGFTIRGDWTAGGTRSIVGTYKLDAFGSIAAGLLRAGRPLVTRDTVRDLGPDEARGLVGLGLRATVCLPLVKDGRLTALMAVHAATPRDWSEAEIRLVADTTQRSWAHIERTRSDAAMRESEVRLRTLTDAIPAFVWFASPDGHLHYLNDRWYAYTGQTPEEALPDGWAATLHPDDAAPTAERWADARARGATYEIEVRYRRRDGAYRWYVARAEPMRDEAGAVVLWFGTSTDIHDRKLAETALQELNETLERRVAERTAAVAESERRFRAIFDTTFQLTGLAALDGTILVVNRAALDAVGARQEDVAGVAVWDSPWFARSPDEVGRLREGVARVARGEFVRYEATLVLAGGPQVLDFSMKPVLDDAGRPVLLVAEGRDITDLKQAEEALRQAQKLEAVGQLTGGVAHDFNNLLTIIRSSTDLLRRPDLPEERRRRYMNAISDTVDRASKLTGQLLAFARRQALKPEVFDVVERVALTGDMLRTVLGARIQVRIEIECERCFAEADVGQFETAIVNMAVNARDAMDGEGMLTVRVETVDRVPAVRGAPARPGRFVAVSLADTGAGIPPERLTQIFEPFFTTKEVGKGTGLGLSQVYGFAKQSGGDVAVESEPDWGSTFTLYLPQVEACAREAAPERREPEPEAGRGRRVLVVEDNVEVGRFSTQILQDLGYETAWASDAREALAWLAGGQSFDVVFSDVVMPGMSGVELGQEIRRRYPGLPVVLTSGYSHVLAEEGRHGFELVHKPYAADELSRVLRRVAGA